MQSFKLVSAQILADSSYHELTSFSSIDMSSSWWEQVTSRASGNVRREGYDEVWAERSLPQGLIAAVRSFLSDFVFSRPAVLTRERATSAHGNDSRTTLSEQRNHSLDASNWTLGKFHSFTRPRASDDDVQSEEHVA